MLKRKGWGNWKTGIALVIVLLSEDAAIARDGGSPSERTAQEWRVAVSAKSDAGRNWALEIFLHYFGKETIEIANADLPWLWAYGIKLTAMKKHSLREQLPLSLPLSDPPLWATRVAPNQTLNGKVNLSARFPTLEKVLESDSVVVLWSFRLGSSPRFSGRIEIPQKLRRGSEGATHPRNATSLRSAVPLQYLRPPSHLLPACVHTDTD